MKELLVIFAYTFIIAFLAIYLRQWMPLVIQYFKRVLTPKKRVLNTRKQIDCIALEKRLDMLEKKVNKRQENQRTAIRQEIRNVLIELKNK